MIAPQAGASWRIRTVRAGAEGLSQSIAPVVAKHMIANPTRLT
jgi:hypothetical protein